MGYDQVLRISPFDTAVYRNRTCSEIIETYLHKYKRH
jgi:hypothetical protein